MQSGEPRPNPTESHPENGEAHPVTHVTWEELLQSLVQGVVVEYKFIAFGNDVYVSPTPNSNLTLHHQGWVGRLIEEGTITAETASQARGGYFKLWKDKLFSVDPSTGLETPRFSIEELSSILQSHGAILTSAEM